jgi:hypothetical protein
MALGRAGWSAVLTGLPEVRRADDMVWLRVALGVERAARSRKRFLKN